MMDGVPSKVNVLLWMASYPWLMFLEGVQSWVDFLIVLFMESVQILVTAPKLQEDGIGTQGISISFMSIKSMSLLKPGTTRCHGTRIARGVPLPVYNNLDLYSGFWCTSRCVVFKYSVPPLTDQALRKVLLTS